MTEFIQNGDGDLQARVKRRHELEKKDGISRRELLKKITLGLSAAGVASQYGDLIGQFSKDKKKSKVLEEIIKQTALAKKYEEKNAEGLNNALEQIKKLSLELQQGKDSIGSDEHNLPPEKE